MNAYVSITFRIGRNYRMLLLRMLHTLGRAGIDSTRPWGRTMRVSSSLHCGRTGCGTTQSGRFLFRVRHATAAPYTCETSYPVTSSHRAYSGKVLEPFPPLFALALGLGLGLGTEVRDRSSTFTLLVSIAINTPSLSCQPISTTDDKLTSRYILQP